MTVEAIEPHTVLLVPGVHYSCSTDTSPSASSLNSPTVAVQPQLYLSPQHVVSELSAAVAEAIWTHFVDCDYLDGPNRGNRELILQEVAAMDALNDSCKPMFSATVPMMSLEQYALRLGRWSRCSIECLPIALCYVRRLKAIGFPVTPRSAHRVLLAALVLAAKSRDDQYFTMSFYATLGGIHRADMNQLEVTLLALLGWDSAVSPEEFNAALRLLPAPRFSTHPWQTVISAMP